MQCDRKIPDKGLNIQLSGALPLYPAFLLRDLLLLQSVHTRYKLKMKSVINSIKNSSYLELKSSIKLIILKVPLKGKFNYIERKV